MSMIQSLKDAVVAFARDEEGAALAEYALILAVVAAVAVTILTTLGGNIETVISTVANKITVPA